MAEAIPHDTLRSAAAGESKIANFLERRWGQLQTKLAEQGAHFQAVAQDRGRAPHPLQPLLNLH